MPRKTKISKKVSKPAVSLDIRKSSEMSISESTPDKESVTKKGGMSFKIHKSTLIIAIVIVLLGVVLYFGRGFIVAAVVNGQPISRLEFVQGVERQAGRQVLSGLVRNILVEQEAKKQNIMITEKQINDQIKSVEDNLKKQGQDIDKMLALEGMTRGDLQKIIRLDLMVTKMVEKDIKVSDKEVNDYIEKNKEILPKDQSESQLKKTVAERLQKQQVSQKAQEWLVNLEKTAKIVKFVNY